MEQVPNVIVRQVQLLKPARRMMSSMSLPCGTAAMLYGR